MKSVSMRRTLLVCMIFGFAALIAPTLWRVQACVVYNPSDSVARGRYRVTLQVGPDALHVGNIVLARILESVAAFAAQRGYLPDGVPILKRIGALAPQSVCIREQVVRIDRDPVVTAQLHDGAHCALQIWAQCRPLAWGELFLLSNMNSVSFDSRYFGSIDAYAVNDLSRPWWAWRAMSLFSCSRPNMRRACTGRASTLRPTVRQTCRRPAAEAVLRLRSNVHGARRQRAALAAPAQPLGLRCTPRLRLAVGRSRERMRGTKTEGQIKGVARRAPRSQSARGLGAAPRGVLRLPHGHGKPHGCSVCRVPSATACAVVRWGHHHQQPLRGALGRESDGPFALKRSRHSGVPQSRYDPRVRMTWVVARLMQQTEKILCTLRCSSALCPSLLPHREHDR